MTKTCSKCKVEQPRSAFFNADKRPDGKCPQCKECMTEYSAKRRAEGKEALNQRKWRDENKSNPRFRASRLMIDAKQRAKKNELPFDLDLDWVEEKLNNGFCEATGLGFDFVPSIPARPFTPSLDRIDPSLGYTKENTQVVCWIYNRAKGVHDHASVVTLAQALCNTKTH